MSCALFERNRRDRYCHVIIGNESGTEAPDAFGLFFRLAISPGEIGNLRLMRLDLKVVKQTLI